MIEKAIEKAEVLLEAFPYIQQFSKKIIVIKYGGSTIEENEIDGSILRDIAFMSTIGIYPVLVHGGGKHISNALKNAGIESAFVQGLRVTDEASIKIVEDVLVNKVNAAIVAKLKEFGCEAVQLSGKMNSMIKVEKMLKKDETGNIVDWGFVGRIKRICPRHIFDAILNGKVPVIAPIGVDKFGQIYNINADTVAAEIAIAISAEKLVYLTDVPGIMRDQKNIDTLISTIKECEVQQLIDDGIIKGGMLPKVEACVKALRNNVSKTHIISGDIKHSLLLEIFTNLGIGTEFVM